VLTKISKMIHNGNIMIVRVYAWAMIYNESNLSLLSKRTTRLLQFGTYAVAEAALGAQLQICSRSLLSTPSNGWVLQESSGGLRSDFLNELSSQTNESHLPKALVIRRQ